MCQQQIAKSSFEIQSQNTTQLILQPAEDKNSETNSLNQVFWHYTTDYVYRTGSS